MHFIFTNQAKKEFDRLEPHTQLLIRKKLEKIKGGGGFLIKPLIQMDPYTHRLRIGDYRLLLRECSEGYEVLKLGHRREIYQS